MRSFTSKSWDRAFVIGPYQTGETIEATLCIEWESAERASDYVKGDAGYVVVFVKGHRVIDWITFNAAGGTRGVGFNSDPVVVSYESPDLVTETGPAQSIILTPVQGLPAPPC